MTPLKKASHFSTTKNGLKPPPRKRLIKNKPPLVRGKTLLLCLKEYTNFKNLTLGFFPHIKK